MPFVSVSPHVLKGYMNLTLYAIVIIYAINSDPKDTAESPSTLLFRKILSIWGNERTDDPAMTNHPTITAVKV